MSNDFANKSKMSSDLFPGVPVVISGPSGVGKTTVKEQLLTRYQDLGASISATMLEGAGELLDQAEKFKKTLA